MIKNKPCTTHKMISKILLLTILGSYLVLSSPVPEIYRKQLKLILEIKLAIQKGRIEVSHPVNVKIQEENGAEVGSDEVVLNVENKSDIPTTTSGSANSSETNPAKNQTAVVPTTPELDQRISSTVPENLVTAETKNFVKDIPQSVTEVPSRPDDVATKHPKVEDQTKDVLPNTVTPNPEEEKISTQALETFGVHDAKGSSKVEEEVIRAAPSPDDEPNFFKVNEDIEDPPASATEKLNIDSSVQGTESPPRLVPVPGTLVEPEINVTMSPEVNPSGENENNLYNDLDNIFSARPEPTVTNRTPLFDGSVTNSGFDGPVTFVSGEIIGVSSATGSSESTTDSDKGVVEVIPNFTEAQIDTEIIPKTEEVPFADTSLPRVETEAPPTTEAVKIESSSITIEESTIQQATESDKLEDTSISKSQTTIPPTAELIEPQNSLINRVETTSTSTTDLVASRTEATNKPVITTTSAPEAPSEMTVSVKVMTATDAPKSSTFTKDRINFFHKTKQSDVPETPQDKLKNLLESALKTVKLSWSEPAKEYKLVRQEGVELIHYAEEVYNEIKPYGSEAIAEFIAVYEDIKEKLSYLAASGDYASMHIKPEIHNMKESLAKVEKKWYPLAKDTPLDLLTSGYLRTQPEPGQAKKIIIYKPRSKVNSKKMPKSKQ